MDEESVEAPVVKPRRGGWPKGKKRGPRKKADYPKGVQDVVAIPEGPPPKVTAASEHPRHMKLSRLNMGSWVEYTVLEVTNAEQPKPGDHLDSKQLSDYVNIGWQYTVIRV